MRDDVTGEVTELLQELIRNGCVNDGSAESGEEARSADLLERYLEGAGLDVERYEPHPGRRSLVARREGTDRDAPTLLLMGHTDVVPVNPERWLRDPFGGELIDGEVWGRGAIDMLNLTASMAVATRRLASRGRPQAGTLVYLAVADEEALGHLGAGWLVDNVPEAVAADFVLTESGGIQIPTAAGPRLPVVVAEKGTQWCTLRVRGTAGHASQPLRTDNALVKAAEVVRRLAEHRPETRIDETWRRFIGEIGLPDDLAEALVEPASLSQLLDSLPVGLARMAHACTHTTVTPTVAHGGTKINVIPDRVDLQVDVRTLPGQTAEEVDAVLADALGDLAGAVEVVERHHDPATASPVETPLWECLGRVSAAILPGSSLVPMMTVGATDSRFFRRVGATAYGFGLFSERVGFETYSAMFHGDDERVDQESLRLSTELWEATAQDLLRA